MQSKIKLFGHPVHPMLVPFPIAFYTATFACSIVYAINGDNFWFHVAFLANCAALVMAAVAVLPGLIDWLAIPELTDAKATGLKHMVANVFTLGFFTANAAVNFTKLHDPHPPVQSSVMLTGFGFLVMLYAGFKGWKLVQTHHVGVDTSTDAEIPDVKEEVKNANELFSDMPQTPGEHQ